MIFRINTFLKVQQQFIKQKYLHKYIFKMDKAYLRHLDDDQFEMTFKYQNPELKVNRPFNFNRKLSETVETFSSRVSINVGKVINKKNKKCKDQETSQANQLLDVTWILNDKEVEKDTLCCIVFQPGNRVVMKIVDKPFQVIVNSPWVDAMSLPMSILASFPTYPSKFETVFTMKALSTFTWSKSKDEKSWIDVGNDFVYTPCNDDIGHYLKLSCIPRNEQSEGPSVETVSVCKVDASPGQCPFEVRHQFTKERTKNNEVRVVTYNILADLYCNSDYTRTVLHPYCPPYALEIDYRKQLILKEIIGYNADIICLQEVDRKVYKYDLQTVLEHLGYGSELSLKGGEVAEGLALFYSKERFRLLETNRLVLSEHISTDEQFSDIWEKISTNDKLASRILDRSTTLQTSVLDVLGQDEVLVVANTHLYFHPDSDHIRLLHGGLCIRYLENFVKEMKRKIPNKRVSLIFCGDFNSVPECGIYKLFTQGEVPKDFIDFQSNKEESINNVELKQPFQLASACGTPKYTNFTAGFQECLDYIFYERNNFQVAQVVPLPSYEEVSANIALPSVVFPSDHIALVSDLKWL
nr:2',5'-phosphodiesterase 12 [Leptinotarsa decemlineata]